MRMGQHRFNVFGQLVVITGAAGNWSAFVLADDGLRRKADFVVPDSVSEDGLCEYLSELFRDSACRTQRAVTRVL
jgi:hypothetical protein